MTLDVINANNEKVSSLELNDEIFGGRVNGELIWEAVVQSNAAARRGTHATKNRALVAGSGRKLWKQKGTGRARIGSIRNPLWRKGGTVFGPHPRSYEYPLSMKIRRGALLAALVQKVRDGSLVVVDQLTLSEARTKVAAELLQRLGAGTKPLLVDVKPDDKLTVAVRNIPDVRFLASGRLVARDVMNAGRIIATRAAVERLQEGL